jgi:hypothetical protein
MSRGIHNFFVIRIKYEGLPEAQDLTLINVNI